MFSSWSRYPLRSVRQWFLLSATLVMGKATAFVEPKYATTQQQNPFLKEVLLGRCYDQPTERGAQLCPVVVDSLLGALNGQVDRNIVPDSYFMFLGWTGYQKVPKDSALFVWPPPTTMDDLDLTLPETTPPGAMVKGLVFCGTDRQMNCPVQFWLQDEGALLAFWQAVYSDFAGKVQGVVRMVLLEDNLASVPNLWKDHVLPSLDFGNVTNVQVIAANCQDLGVSDLIQGLEISAKKKSFHCTPIETPSTAKGDLASSCEIGDLLHNKSPIKTGDHKVSPPVPSSVDCECSASVYEVLFWALVLLGVGGVYAMWSVWHYLPDYQTIPNVQHDLVLGEEGRTSLPKQ